MKKNVIIYAIGIHKGGGLQVLKQFIKSNKNFLYIFDSRLDSIHYKNVKKFKIVKQGLINSIKTNIELKKKNNSDIFFINGLPPLLKLSSNIFVLYQNLNIFPPNNLYKLLYWFFSLDFLRYIFFKIGYKNVQSWLVLSDVANQTLSKKIKNYSNIIKVFFFDIHQKKIISKKKFDFIYPADLKRHKNHSKIISALVDLSKEKIKPSFLFTLNEYEKKKLNFNALEKKINIHNFSDFNNRLKFIKKLQQSKCLFFPSEQETIGLPIIEGYNNNLYIATSNEVYARQFIEPDKVFNINSANSIKKTIKKIYLSKFKKKRVNKIKNFELYLKKKNFFRIIND